jgi:hypothetical protein
MTLRGVPAVTIIVLLGLGVQAKAQGPCAEVLRLRNAASEAWKHAMSAPASQRCGALAQVSVATEATLNYADNNRQSCNISDRLLNEVDGYHRQAVQARARPIDRNGAKFASNCPEADV